MTITQSPVTNPPPTHRRCGSLKYRMFEVDSVLRRVNVAVLCENSTAFRRLVMENADPNMPIVLHGPTARQFDHLLWGLSVDPMPQPPNEEDVERLLDVEELSRRYSIHCLQIRAETTVLAVIAEGTNTAVLSCRTNSLVRMLSITMRVHNKTLFAFLMQMWTWRLHSKELDYILTIRVAQPSHWDHDPQPFLKLLGHAFYAAMMDLEPKLSSGQRIDLDCQLTSSEIVHVLCGYHSLRCWWDQIASKPPAYMHCARCMYPERCSYVWRIRFRWLAEKDRISFPKVDGIRRLQEIHRFLAGDLFLIKNMPETCRHNALQELLKRREHLLKTVHHHFDL
ncbi:hypothetical protein J3R30DRAFT_2097198 [Lentinula aciculospora]|uniref:BTB domain-containing protein n=1 Tax=Lentinula aciculospora TaxID=153920 RepID=A0A9W9DR96_9AGAR|nr:hypothetical protein J3R30DRAFT_2097198 [Lentinula aciculospora]